VLPDDDPTEIAERTRVVDAADFLLVDESGQPAGVLRREDIVAVLNSSRSRKWSRQ
jgi:Mg/Co/Ni transporter MgtE